MRIHNIPVKNDCLVHLTLFVIPQLYPKYFLHVIVHTIKCDNEQNKLVTIT